VLDGGSAINGEGPRCEAVLGRGRAEAVEWGRRECGGALMAEWWRWTGAGAAGDGGTAGGQWRKKGGGGQRKKKLPTGGPHLSARGEGRRGAGGPRGPKVVRTAAVRSEGKGWAAGWRFGP
jgi:hypothetical protein